MGVAVVVLTLGSALAGLVIVALGVAILNSWCCVNLGLGKLALGCSVGGCS